MNCCPTVKTNYSHPDELSSTSADELSSTSADELSSTRADEQSSTGSVELSSTTADELSSTGADELSFTSADELSSTSADELSSTSADVLSSTSADELSSPVPEMANDVCDVEVWGGVGLYVVYVYVVDGVGFPRSNVEAAPDPVHLHVPVDLDKQTCHSYSTLVKRCTFIISTVLYIHH